MSIERGDIYYITNNREAVGSEQIAGRPAIVVSNDKNNEFSTVLEVVYLTSQPKTYLPTHVDITSSNRNSIALCEQVTTVSVKRVGDYIGHCDEEEMYNVDEALAISLGIESHPSLSVDKNVNKERTSLDEKQIRLEAERDFYKQMYEQMLHVVVAR